MASSYASTTVTGFIGRDPEVRQVGDTSVLTFSICSNRKRKSAEYSTWWRVSVWGRSAQMCAERLRQGSYVQVIGEAYQSQYQARSGETKYQLEIDTMDGRVVFLDKAEPQQQWSGQQQQAPQQQAPQQQQWNAQQQAPQQQQWGGQPQQQQQAPSNGADPIPF